MKKIYNYTIGLLALLLLAGCEDEIYPALEQVENVMVVDAWLNNKPGDQVIYLTMTQSYFDSSLPPGVANATVQVENLTSGEVFAFAEASRGKYVWTPASPSQLIGQSGDNYRLLIEAGSESYEALSKMGRVPVIDSVTFTFEEENAFFPDSYNAEFWATDIPGAGDTYWIKAIKNDTLLNKPSEISLAYDAGFSQSANFDGDRFIPPIRSSINPYDQDEDDNYLSPYDFGDSVYVEIHSITLSSFNFLTELKIQTDRPGGFGELFATPLANVSSNINNRNEGGKKAIGFFNVAAVSGAGKRLVAK